MRQLFTGLVIVVIALGVALGFPQARQALGNMEIEPSNAEVVVTAVPGTEPPPPPPSPPPPPPSPPPLLPTVVAFVNGVPQPRVGEATTALATKPVRLFAQDLSAYLDFGTGTLFTFDEPTDITRGVLLDETVYPIGFLEWMGGMSFAVSGESPPAGGFQLVGAVYRGYPAGARFSPPGLITVVYDEAMMPPDVTEAELRIYRYDGATGEWWPLPDCVVDVENNTITAPLSRFSLFAVLASTPTPAFTVTNLTIEPGEVEVGGEVVISFAVVNEGDATGTYEARLVIDGVLEESWEVSLTPDESQTLTHTVTIAAPGLYSVEVGGLTGSFRVVTAGDEPGEGGFPWVLAVVIAGVVLALAAVVFWVVRRRLS